MKRIVSLIYLARNVSELKLTWPGQKNISQWKGHASAQVEYTCTETLTEPDGGAGHLLRPSPAEIHELFSRIGQIIYHSKDLSSYNPNP
jgi:hypothetical protein